MVTLKEIKDNMSSKIIIPKEFDDFYEWTTNQIEKHGEYFISGCFEWRSDNYDAIKQWFNFDCTERFGVFGAGLTGNLYAFKKLIRCRSQAARETAYGVLGAKLKCSFCQPSVLP